MQGLRWSSMKRSRWAAIGAAVAVTVGSGGLMSASADISSGEKPVFVSITPCRVADTRPTETVGPRNTPLGANETYSFAVRGTNGNCTIPADAIGVAVNIAAVFPTASSFFTLYPADAPTRPLSANLNFVGGQPPVSNSASIRLSADGRMAIYNLAGSVHFTLDITGYYVSHNHNDLYYTKAEIDSSMSFAVVNSGLAPTVTRSSGTAAVPVTVARIAAGRYSVDFGRNITACAYTGTLGDVGTGVAGPGQIDVASRAGNAEAVFVRTSNSAGTDTDIDFHLTVVC